MTKELDNLLSLIFQSGGKIEVREDKLLVGPATIAQKFGEQIKRLKPEIMLALGHCPVCASKLVLEVEHRTRLSDQKNQTGIATYCGLKGHYDSWKS